MELEQEECNSMQNTQQDGYLRFYAYSHFPEEQSSNIEMKMLWKVFPSLCELIRAYLVPPARMNFYISY